MTAQAMGFLTPAQDTRIEFSHPNISLSHYDVWGENQWISLSLTRTQAEQQRYKQTLQYVMLALQMAAWATALRQPPNVLNHWINEKSQNHNPQILHETQVYYHL